MTKLDTVKKTVNQLTVEKNWIDGQIAAIENQYRNENLPVLISEILNLRDGVGEGFKEGDYYAPSRYYSRIPGVKNIRFRGNPEWDDHFDAVEVKVVSPTGKLLPSMVKIDGKEIQIHVYESERYSNTVDY